MAKIPPPPFHRVGDKLNAGPDFVLMFGKYKGATVADVMELEPAYLVWAHDNVEYFKLHDDMLNEVYMAMATLAAMRAKLRREILRNVRFSIDDENDYDDY